MGTEAHRERTAEIKSAGTTRQEGNRKRERGGAQGTGDVQEVLYVE